MTNKIIVVNTISSTGNGVTLDAGDQLEIIAGVNVGTTASGFSGVFSTGSNVSISVDGSLFGDNAIFLTSGSAHDRVKIGTQGIVSAFDNAIDIAGNGDSVTNDGQITSQDGDGVSLGAGSKVMNDGTIDGQTAGVAVTSGATVTNTGTIQGGTDGVQFTSGTNILNNSAGSTISADTAVDMGAGGGRIDNDGHIFGDIDLGGAATRLTNTGTITGNISGTGPDTINNMGTIDGSLTFGAASTYNWQFNGVAGAITGAITGSSGDDKIFIADTYSHKITGGDGNDVVQINDSQAGAITFYGGLGVDTFTGFRNQTTFIYKHVDESRGVHYDTLNFSGAFKIDVSTPVLAVDPIVGAGHPVQLDKGPNFTTELAALLGPAQLHAHDAVEVVANQGTAFGTYLVIDANGVAGYQVDGDYVIKLSDSNAVTIHNFG